MVTIDFTPELIAGVVGVALSWLYGWFPGLRTWFAALKPEIKSAIMLGSLALTSLVIYLLTVYGAIQVDTPITVWKLLSVFFVASTINQAAYSLTPLNREVKDIKTEKVIEEIQAIDPAAIPCVEEPKG